jgi:3-dehydroquinate synthase
LITKNYDLIPYPVYFGNGIFKELSENNLFNQYSNVVLCVDKNVSIDSLNIDSSKIFKFSVEREEVKSIERITELLTFFKDQQLDRKSLVIAVGGGAVGDAVGFAASIYMRGVTVLQVPTTLLSMVDSSVGAKTAINFEGIKNLIGTFYPPVAVCIDTDFLKTLPKREFLSGFSEIIKHGIIEGKTQLDKICCMVSNLNGNTNVDDKLLLDLVIDSIETKANIVGKDPTEKGLRKALNLGHTIGHVIESISHINNNSPFLHGEAISYGLTAELSLASKILKFDLTSAQKAIELLMSFNLPDLSKLNATKNDILELIKFDKKNVKGTLNFALPNKIGDIKLDVSASIDDVYIELEKLGIKLS